MRRFFRRRRINLGKYVAPEPLPEPTIAELVDEGVMIAAAGVRLAVKNLMIIKSVRDSLDYDQDRYESAVREELLNLALEKDADAARIASTRQKASSRSGRPERHNDYRSIDEGALRRRESVSRELAARLRDVSADEGWASAIVADARTSALDDLASAAATAVHSAPVADDPEYRRHRPARLRELAEDIMLLQVTPPEDRP